MFIEWIETYTESVFKKLHKVETTAREVNCFKGSDHDMRNILNELKRKHDRVDEIFSTINASE